MLCQCFSLSKVMTFSDVNTLFSLSSSLASSLSLVIFAKLTSRLFCPLIATWKMRNQLLNHFASFTKILSTVEVKIIPSTYSQPHQGQSHLYLRNAETVDVITQTFNFVTTRLRLCGLKCHSQASFGIRNGDKESVYLWFFFSKKSGRLEIPEWYHKVTSMLIIKCLMVISRSELQRCKSKFSSDEICVKVIWLASTFPSGNTF